MDLIPSDWKYFETFRKRLLKTFFYNSKGTKKVKDFGKHSNKKKILQNTFQFYISWEKPNGWKKTIFSVMIYGENVLVIGLLNIPVVILFLSGINLSILLPLNPAIYRIGNTPNILCPRCKEQDESFLLLQVVQNYSRLHQPTNTINLSYKMIVSEPSQ